MARILCIETSTVNCSVALSREESLFERQSCAGNDHAAKIAVFIDEVLREAALRPEDLDAVAVGKGPGSYTGLRIGVATAKGLAYALQKPLLSVSPLQAMAWEAVSRLRKTGDVPADALFCPMTDAGRMEVYSAFYNLALDEVRGVQADIVEAGYYDEYLAEHPVYFFGNGAGKCKAVLGVAAHARFIDNITPDARSMAALAQQAFQEGRFEDTAYFEPFYLKDFKAGKPHVKGLE
ncbi:MAG: tRNA (adenosine(37)-N6)-threonylcarbamoyltransferase complex dimerization subunit type 1 TsaB, partial [Bacteroidales bacterium]|nr:tRNA (adenosine(37)-N6)-threonylcarbamoyltransferase complex dimerization subunit type 1 TsaB [Bacteroidales bacterium]